MLGARVLIVLLLVFLARGAFPQWWGVAPTISEAYCWQSSSAGQQCAQFEYNYWQDVNGDGA